MWMLFVDGELVNAFRNFRTVRRFVVRRGIEGVVSVVFA